MFCLATHVGSDISLGLMESLKIYYKLISACPFTSVDSFKLARLSKNSAPEVISSITAIQILVTIAIETPYIW